MKRIVMLLFVVIGIQITAWSQKITIEVRGVRNVNGNIMVMIQADEQSKPLYGMAKASQGKVMVTIENAPLKTFLLSAFHDENGDWKMRTDEKGMPTEGYVREKCQLKDVDATVKVKLYYPIVE